MCTSGAVRQSCWKEKGSNEPQSNIDACSIKRKPHKLKPDEPHPPVNHAAISRNLSDDGQRQKPLARPRRHGKRKAYSTSTRSTGIGRAVSGSRKFSRGRQWSGRKVR